MSSTLSCCGRIEPHAALALLQLLLKRVLWSNPQPNALPTMIFESPAYGARILPLRLSGEMNSIRNGVVIAAKVDFSSRMSFILK